MQTAFSAPQSRNLSEAHRASFTNKPSLIWLLVNLLLRRSARSIVAHAGKSLIVLAAIFAVLCFEVSVISGDSRMVAATAVASLLCLLPEFVTYVYSHKERR